MCCPAGQENKPRYICKEISTQVLMGHKSKIGNTKIRKKRIKAQGFYKNLVVWRRTNMCYDFWFLVIYLPSDNHFHNTHVNVAF